VDKCLVVMFYLSICYSVVLSSCSYLSILMFLLPLSTEMEIVIGVTLRIEGG